MSASLTPRESGEHIVRHAKYVIVLGEGIDRLTEEIVSGVVGEYLIKLKTFHVLI